MVSEGTGSVHLLAIKPFPAS